MFRLYSGLVPNVSAVTDMPCTRGCLDLRFCWALRAAETTAVKYRLELSDIGDHHVAITKTLDGIPWQSKMSVFTYACNYHNPPSPLGQRRGLSTSLKLLDDCEKLRIKPWALSAQCQLPDSIPVAWSGFKKTVGLYQSIKGCFQNRMVSLYYLTFLLTFGLRMQNYCNSHAQLGSAALCISSARSFHELSSLNYSCHSWKWQQIRQNSSGQFFFPNFCILFLHPDVGRFCSVCVHTSGSFQAYSH